MRPVSGAALGAAALVTSPALAAAATGALPVDVALTRYLLAAGLCWVLLAVAEEWWWPTPGRTTGTGAGTAVETGTLSGAALGPSSEPRAPSAPGEPAAPEPAPDAA